MQRSREAERQRAGFTLIELVIGVAVLLTALLGLLGVFVGIHAINESARHTTIATQHADRIMEEVRRSDFPGEIVPNASAADDAAWVAWAAAHALDLTEPNLNGVAVDFEPPFEGGGAPAWDPEPEVWLPTDDPLRIQIRVKWVERSGRVRVTYVESLVTER